MSVFLFVVAGTAVAMNVSEGARAIAGRYEEFYRKTQNTALLWLAAEAYAQDRDTADAVRLLKEIAGRRLGLVPTPDSPLERLRGEPAYDQLAAQLRAEYTRVGQDHLAFVIRGAGLIPEGLTVDPRHQRIFIGDMVHRQILVRERDGHIHQFATTQGLPPLGMKVDEQRSRLWVATTNGFIKPKRSRTALLAFDLVTGRRVGSFTSPELQSINDLCVVPNGNIYVTDSLRGSVFRLTRGDDQLRPITPAHKFDYPNGIASSPDGRTLFIAEALSIKRLDLKSLTATALAQPTSSVLMGVDGLYWYRNGLVAIQNVGNPGRVLGLPLSDDTTAVSRILVLSQASPAVALPTTGGISGRTLFMIGNSQIDRFGNGGRIVGSLRLAPINIIETRLPPIL